MAEPDPPPDLDARVEAVAGRIEAVRRAEERSRPGDRDRGGRWLKDQRRYVAEVNDALRALLDLESEIGPEAEPAVRDPVVRRVSDQAFDLVPAVSRLRPHRTERDSPAAEAGRMTANVVRRGWDAAVSTGDAAFVAHAYGRARGSVDERNAVPVVEILVTFADSMHRAGLHDEATLTADLAEAIWQAHGAPDAALGSIERKRTLQTDIAATWTDWEPDPSGLVAGVRNRLEPGPAAT